jgi:hypothetical protein
MNAVNWRRNESRKAIWCRADLVTTCTRAKTLNAFLKYGAPPNTEVYGKAAPAILAPYYPDAIKVVNFTLRKVAW